MVNIREKFLNEVTGPNASFLVNLTGNFQIVRFLGPVT